MKHKRSVKTKHYWHLFFSLEKDFYSWVNKNTKVIHSNELKELLSYQEMKSSNDDSFNKAPKHVRHICMVTSKESEKAMVERIEALKKAYEIAFLTQSDLDNKPVENDNIKYPIRFPLFRKNIYQVNLSINRAYSSVSIKKDCVTPEQVITLKENINLSFTENLIDQLIKFGLKSSELIEKKINEEQSKYSITVLARELIEVLNTEELQIRKPTGKQYRARLYSLDSDIAPEVVKFGFIVLDTEASIHNVLPQKPKPNLKFSLKKLVEFPVKLDVEIYK